MDDILQNLKLPVNKNVLVDTRNGDDAGIYKLNDQLALVQTTDFFTPIVDDPYLFGQIAAANSLSDIYAMGATPISALNIACFPDDILDARALCAILQGGADKVAESGAVVIGGHTVTDKELKYGLAVTGLIDPANIKKNNSIKKGDKLLLTKPIGTGILTTALKNDHFTEPDIGDAIRSMLLLNRDPAMLLQKYKANAVTDITGFGLLGHLKEMIAGTGLGALISVEDIPVFDKARPMAQNANYIPGGTLANINFVQSTIIMDKIPVWYLNILADPQTSGGLLISMPQSEINAFKDELENYPYQICEIGEIQSGNENITLV